jgi:hypothetical protein
MWARAFELSAQDVVRQSVKKNTSLHILESLSFLATAQKMGAVSCLTYHKGLLQLLHINSVYHDFTFLKTTWSCREHCLVLWVMWIILGTISMKQSLSLEAECCSVSQEFPQLLWNLKVYTMFTRTYYQSLFWAKLIYSTHSAPCFFKIHFNIIFPYTPRSYKWSLPIKFSNQNFVCISYLSHA